MPRICTSCGASVADTARFCNKCGTPFQPTQPAPTQTTPHSGASGYQSPPSYQQHPQPQYGAPSSASGLQPNVAGLLTYVFGFVTGIIFLALDPYNKDRFVRFHAFQSILLSVALIVLLMGLNIVYFILPWWLDWIVTLVQLVVQLGGFVLWIFSMFKAYNGEKLKLPIISDLAEQQAGR
jgi:uncharacterized membrane protein